VTESFVVLWRATPTGRWQVQPFIYAEAEAEAIGARLMAQFHGEAWLAPVEVPHRLDTSDLQGEP
jgi:hypothetical protein